MTRSCWVLTPGQAGFEAQGRGLAEALGMSPQFIALSAGWPWTMLPGGWWPAPLRVLRAAPTSLTPPWPDLVISCGRIAAPAAVAIRAASGGMTRAVHIQHPRMNPDRFDLVAAPRHDGLTGPNVVTTIGAVHPVTQAKLDAAGERWRAAFAALPRPLVAVLIGGSNGRFTLDAVVATTLADQLAAITGQGAGLVVTASRRTGKENEALLRRRLASAPAFVWDGVGDNPYLGMLALADAIVVTEDSVSMTSEALATGKPVYVARLQGGSARLRRFQDGLIADGYTREFTGQLHHWSYDPPDDTARAAEECRRRFGWR